MVRVSEALLQKAGLLSKTLTEILIKNGIPCLVPTDGKILEEEDISKPEDIASSSARNEGSHGTNS